MLRPAQRSICTPGEDHRLAGRLLADRTRTSSIVSLCASIRRVHVVATASVYPRKCARRCGPLFLAWPTISSAQTFLPFVAPLDQSADFLCFYDAGAILLSTFKRLHWALRSLQWLSINSPRICTTTLIRLCCFYTVFCSPSFKSVFVVRSDNVFALAILLQKLSLILKLPLPHFDYTAANLTCNLSRLLVAQNLYYEYPKQYYIIAITLKGFQLIVFFRALDNQ